MMDEEPDYLFISKIYDVLSAERFLDKNFIFNELHQRGIVRADIEKMEQEGLLAITDLGIELKPAIYTYLRPETLRGNWIYLEPLTRRRFVNHAAIPSVVDLYRWLYMVKRVWVPNSNETLGGHWENQARYSNAQIQQLDDFKHKVNEWNREVEWMAGVWNPSVPKAGRNGLYQHIVNFFEARQKPFLVFSSLMLTKPTIDFLQKSQPELKFKKHINVVDTIDTCPIGLDKAECEQYWKQESGDNFYAYKDCIITRVPVRIHLSRRMRCVGVELTREAVHNRDRHFYMADDAAYRYGDTFHPSISINYEELKTWLKDEEVLDIVEEIELTIAGARRSANSKGAREMLKCEIVEGLVELNRLFTYVPIGKKRSG